MSKVGQTLVSFAYSKFGYGSLGSFRLLAEEATRQLAGDAYKRMRQWSKLSPRFRINRDYLPLPRIPLGLADFRDVVAFIAENGPQF